MKSNDYTNQHPDGYLICRWRGDPSHAQIIARPNEQGTYSPFEVTRLLADAYAAGRRHAREDIRHALGIKVEA
jgi:hypothetical protein